MSDTRLNISITATEAEASAKIKALQASLREFNSQLQSIAQYSANASAAAVASFKREEAAILSKVAAIRQEMAALTELTAAGMRASRSEAEYINRDIDLINKKVQAQIRASNEAARAAQKASDDAARFDAEQTNKSLALREAQIRAQMKTHNERVYQERAAEDAALAAAARTTRQEAEHTNTQMDAAALRLRQLADYENRDRDLAYAKMRREAEFENAQRDAAARTRARLEQQAQEEASGGILSRLARPQMFRHFVAIPDAEMRGQTGQMFASLGAMARDSGIGVAGLATSMGALIAVMSTTAILRSAEHMARWATETRAAASAAGMTIATYSQLQGALTLSGLKATEADSALRRLSENLGTALADPASKAAEGFNALGITQEMLARNGQDVNGVLRLLADAWVRNADGANKSAAAEAVMGRGFEALIPLLQGGGAAIDTAKEKAQALGITLTDHTAKSLEETGQKVEELSAMIRGQGVASMEAWGPAIRSVVNILESLVTVLGQATSGVGQFLGSIGQFLSAPVTSMMGGTRGFGPSEQYFKDLDRRLHPEKYVDTAAGATGLDAAADALRTHMTSRVATPAMPVKGAEETVMQKIAESEKAAGLAAAQSAFDAHQKRAQITEATTRAEIASLQKSLASETLTDHQRAQLRGELLQKQISLVNEEAAGAGKANNQATRDYIADIKLRVAEAEGNSSKILAIYDEEIAKLKQLVAAHKATMAQVAEAERDKVKAYTAARLSEIGEETRIQGIRERLIKAAGEEERLRTGRPESAATAESYRKQAADIDAAAAQTIAKYAEIMNAAEKGSSVEQKAAEAILNTVTDAKEKEVALYKKAEEETKKAAQAFTQFFDAMGSSVTSFFSSLVDTVISPQHELIKAGLTTIKKSLAGQEIASAFQSMLKGAISSAGNMVEQALSKTIASAISGGTASSIGELLGNWLSKAFSSIIGSSTGSAVGATAASVPVVTAIGASTTAITGAITASTTAITTALSVLVAKPTIFGTTFAAGGIVSAQGGMIAGGAVPAFLHPQEMVLPAAISRGLQALITGGAYGGGSANVNYAPTINTAGSRSRGGMTKSDFGDMLSSHSREITGMARELFTQGWRPISNIT